MEIDTEPAEKIIKDSWKKISKERQQLGQRKEYNCDFDLSKAVANEESGILFLAPPQT